MNCRGFRAAGVAAGIKKDGEKDLGLIVSEVPANAAGIFTKNRIQAACVLLDKLRIESGRCSAVIVNSGNANCCNGEQGMRDAMEMAKSTAKCLGISENLVLVSSTGIIGVPLPVSKIKAALPSLVSSSDSKGFSDFAEAIMTTDTVPKTVSRQGRIKGKIFTVAGIAKGSGMIRPDMATMLCFVCTDIDANHDFLKRALFSAAQRSFNRISVDGDTSTNDMILIMANGLSEAAVKDSSQKEYFQNILDDVLFNLAKKVVKDGEGASKFVEIAARNCLTKTDALKLADTVANSNLVKTALFGEDANWGRILAAAGRANVPLKPEIIDILFNNVLIFTGGVGCGSKAELRAEKVLKKDEFTITVNLNLGNQHASIFTCDFSYDYVRINANYRS